MSTKIAFIDVQKTSVHPLVNQSKFEHVFRVVIDL